MAVKPQDSEKFTMHSPAPNKLIFGHAYSPTINEMISKTTSKANKRANKAPLQTVSQPIAYGRMRRWLGIVYVGLLVTASTLALELNLPRALFSTTQQGLGVMALELTAALSIFALASMPLDLAGFEIEKRYARSTSTYASFFSKQIAANFRHGATLLIMAILIATINRSFGLPGLALWSAIATSLLLAGQLKLAFFYAGIPAATAVECSRPAEARTRHTPVMAVRTAERCFTGGIVGMPRQEKIVIPERWLTELSEGELGATLLRREAVISSGLRMRGLLLAAVFNCSGMLLAATLTEKHFSLPIDSAAGLVTMSALFTIWSFIGLLSLPSITHLAVYEADRLAVQNGARDSVLRQVITHIDEDMGEESSRTAAIDKIFHPVPTAAHRLEVLSRPHASGHNTGAWQAARYALFLSVAGLGLLGRAVHCNAGKPELWAMLPAD